MHIYFKKYAHNLLAQILGPVFILLPKKTSNVLQTPHTSSTETWVLCGGRKDTDIHGGIEWKKKNIGRINAIIPKRNFASLSGRNALKWVKMLQDL